MKANKLVYIFLLASMIGFSSHSFATPVSMDAEGVVTNYTYSGDIDPLSGLVNIGDTFTSMSILDPATAVDATPEDDSIGRYNWYGSLSGTSFSVGGLDQTYDSTMVTILNDFVLGDTNIDLYRLDSYLYTDYGFLNVTVGLSDRSGLAFDNDSFVLEPDISVFPSSWFLIRSFDFDYTLNYSIFGNLTSLVDPPLEIASVPEPNTVFLLGLGLIAIFLASKSYRKEEKFAA